MPDSLIAVDRGAVVARTLSDLAKGNVISALAAIVLAYQGILAEKDRNGWVIGIALAVGVTDAIVGYVLVRRARQQARQEGLLRDHLGDLTMHLAELATDRPQDWAADLLLVRPRRWWWNRTDVVLRRATFHRLGSGTVLAAAVGEHEESPATACLQSGSDVMWSMVELPNGTTNFADTCDVELRGQLASSAGACRCTLVTDRNEARTLGVLAIYYVADTPELIVGTMEQQKFADTQRRVAKAVGRALTED